MIAYHVAAKSTSTKSNYYLLRKSKISTETKLQWKLYFIILLQELLLSPFIANPNHRCRTLLIRPRGVSYTSTILSIACLLLSLLLLYYLLNLLLTHQPRIMSQHTSRCIILTNPDRFPHPQVRASSIRNRQKALDEPIRLQEQPQLQVLCVQASVFC